MRFPILALLAGAALIYVIGVWVGLHLDCTGPCSARFCPIRADRRREVGRWS